MIKICRKFVVGLLFCFWCIHTAQQGSQVIRKQQSISRMSVSSSFSCGTHQCFLFVIETRSRMLSSVLCWYSEKGNLDKNKKQNAACQQVPRLRNRRKTKTKLYIKSTQYITLPRVGDTRKHKRKTSQWSCQTERQHCSYLHNDQCYLRAWSLLHLWSQSYRMHVVL